MNDKKKVENKKYNFEFYTEIDKKQDIIIPELTFKNIQTEMILFKNDILKDINLITKELTEKHEKYAFLLRDEVKKRNNLFKDVENKIKDLSDLITVSNQTKEKIENLLEFKNKMEEYTITNEIRFNNLEKDTSENFYRQDKIFKETVFYPGVIGPTCKYKSFHDLIDYFINEITGLLKYKERNEIELDLYKNRLEGIISGFKLQIENFTISATQFTKKTVNQLEKKINEKLLKYEDLINSNRIQCCKSCTDLEKKIIDYKLVNEDNMKNINDKIDKLQKQIQDKINEITKKQNRNDISGDYNRKFNKGMSKMNLKNGIRQIKSANEKDENNKLDNNKKTNSEKSDIKENEINKNKKEDSNQVNYDDIKNLENKLKAFIKNEIKIISEKIYKSLKNTKDEINLSLQSITHLYSNKDESYSCESEKHFITKTEIDRFKEKNFTNVNLKRYSHVQNKFNKKNIFDQIMKKRQEKKILLNRYIFEKIKEVFEESIEDSENEIDIKNEKPKVKKDYMSIPKIREMFNDPEIQKELIYRKIYNSTKIIPIITKIKKPKQIKDNLKKEIKPKPKFPEGKKIIKSPIKIPLTAESQNTQNIEKKNLTEQIKNKPKIEVKENNNNNKDIEHKKRPYSKQVGEHSTTHIHKKKDKIEFKEELIKTPKIKRNQHLSNFTITLQGTKKLNIDSLDNLINDNTSNINQISGSTIYMNFPRTTHLLNQRIFESFHPIYKNKKYSKYIKPYISALTNNYQSIFNRNELKSAKEKKKKKTLAWNKSDNNLTKNKILKMKDNKEIKLPEIMDDEFIKNYKHYSPLNEDKFKALIEKDLFKYKSNRNNIQDIYLNKDNRFSQLTIKEKTSFINLKKKI